MTLAGKAAKVEAVANYTASLPSDYHQTLRHPLTNAPVGYYSPLEIPSILCESLAQLNKQ
jgi:hypothetical protein